MIDKKSGLKEIVDNIYNDEEVSKARITKGDIKIIVKAFGRQMIKMLKEDGEFNLRGFFKVSVKEMGGWNAKTLDGETVKVSLFKRTYFSLAKNAKEYLNSK